MEIQTQKLVASWYLANSCLDKDIFCKKLFFQLTLHEKKNFRHAKICEKERKDHIFISFRMFPFDGNIIFS